MEDRGASHGVIVSVGAWQERRAYRTGVAGERTRGTLVLDGYVGHLRTSAGLAVGEDCAVEAREHILENWYSDHLP